MAEGTRTLTEQGNWIEAEKPEEIAIPAEIPRITPDQIESLRIRRFVLDRTEDVSGTSGTGIVAEGVCYSDGVVALRWVVELRSTCVYQSVEDVVAIHGHDGRTSVVWLD